MFAVKQNGALSSIYPSTFTNVRFWTKIEFSNVVKCRKGSQDAVSSTNGSWWSPAGGSEAKVTENLGLFTSGGEINSLKSDSHLTKKFVLFAWLKVL